MNSNSRTAVSADLGLGLVGPEHTIVPLMASLYYSSQDPYAVKIPGATAGSQGPTVARYQAPASGGGTIGGTIASIRCGPGSA